MICFALSLAFCLEKYLYAYLEEITTTIMMMMIERHTQNVLAKMNSILRKERLMGKPSSLFSEKTQQHITLLK